MMFILMHLTIHYHNKIKFYTVIIARSTTKETHHEMRIPECDVTHIVLSVYFLTLIHRYALNQKQSH